MTQTDTAQLIALDWGSTSVRAYLIGARGQTISTRSATLGASFMNGDDDYTSALDKLCGDWMLSDPAVPILACGMVGSKHGWQEVPYVACPGGDRQLGAAIQKVARKPVHIVPGLLFEPEDAAPDVMRGEETQILGALHLQPELAQHACLILPGTHSKWAEVVEGKVTRFATHMTGELFAVLRQHSVLGKLMPEKLGETDLPSFLAGVDAARADDGLLHQLFAVRTLGLTQKMPGAQLPDYLSGLLIGTEIKDGLRWRSAYGQPGNAMALIGEPAICNLYRHALQRFDQSAVLQLNNTASAGLWRLAQAAGMIKANQPDTTP